MRKTTMKPLKVEIDSDEYWKKEMRKARRPWYSAMNWLIVNCNFVNKLWWKWWTVKRYTNTETVKRGWGYYKNVVLEDTEWHINYLLKVMLYKLKLMSSFFRSDKAHGLPEFDEIKSRHIDQLIRVISIQEQYSSDSEGIYINTRNAFRFVKDGGKDRYQLRQEKAWHLMWLILEVRSRDWWD